MVGCSAESVGSLTQAATQHAAKGEYVAAIANLKTVLQLRGEAPEIRYLLGRTLLQSGDPAAAFVELSKAHDQLHNDNEVVPEIARSLLLLGEFRKLVTHYQHVTLTDATAAASLKTTLATAWAGLGDRARTEENLRAALEAQPSFRPARILQARMIAGQGRFDEAEQVVDEVLAEDATLAEAWHLQGEIREMGFNDPSGAQDAFRKALSRERAYLPSHLALITGRVRAGDLQGATAQAEALRQVLPRHAKTHLVLAQLAYARGDHEAARDGVQELLRQAPDYVDGLMLAGTLELEIGSPVLAEAHFSKALKLLPDHSFVRRSMAETSLRLGKIRAAVQWLEPLLDDARRDAKAHALAGEAFLQLNDPQAAARHFDLAVSYDPNNLRIRTARALTHLSNQDAARAFEELEELAARSPDTHADHAIVQARIRRREYDAALAAADVMVRKDAGNAELQVLRGTIHLARRNLLAAREAFEVATRIDPALFGAVSQLANLDVLEGQPGRARDRLLAVLKRQPQNVAGYLALADVRARSEASPEEVIGILKEAVKVAPTDARPRLQLIDITLRRRQFNDALTYAQEAMAALPNHTEVLRAVGRAQLEAKEFEQAISTYRQLADRSDRSAESFVHLAEVYSAAGRLQNAQAALIKAIELDPKLTRAQELFVTVMVDGQRQEEALAAARGLQQRQPNRSAGYVLEAGVLLRMNRFADAVQTMQRGLKVEGQESTLPREYYQLLRQSNRRSEAEEWARQWLSAHPGDLSFEYLVAGQAMADGRLDDAEARLRRVVALRPHHAYALNNLAWVLAQRGKAGALEHAQRAVELRPDHAQLLDTLALTLANEKQVDKALAVQKRAVELAPDDNALRLGLARIAVQAGDRQLARSELQRLRVLGADFAFREEINQLLPLI